LLELSFYAKKPVLSGKREKAESKRNLFFRIQAIYRDWMTPLQSINRPAIHLYEIARSVPVPAPIK
jgi:hypothetical protein